jgi:signal transduction histidine kinase
MYLYVAVAVTSISLVGSYSYFQSRAALRTRAFEQLTSVKSIKKVQLENFFEFNQKITPQQEAAFLNTVLADTTQTRGLGRSGEVYVVDDQFYIKSKSRFNNYQDNRKIRVYTSAARKAFKSGEGHSVTYDYRGIKCLSSYDRLNIKGRNWIILAEIDYDEAMAPTFNLRNDIVLISLVIILLIFSIAQIITTDIIRPVARLKDAAMRIGSGDYTTKVLKARDDEFGLLATAFNQMMDDIKKNTDELLLEKTKRITALFDGQEMERHRISADLHDGLAQQLIAIRLTLDNIINRNEFLDQNKVNNLRNQILVAVDEVRKISYDLAPAGLLDFTLDIALSNLVNQMQGNSDIQIDFSAFGNFNGIEQKAKIYLFRIAQEAISNTLKHAAAGQIHVQLTETSQHYVLIIEDDGKGFNFDKNKPGLGKGLFSMQERSLLLNGTFDVETSPENGTTIRVKVNKSDGNG